MLKIAEDGYPAEEVTYAIFPNGYYPNEELSLNNPIATHLTDEEFIKRYQFEDNRLVFEAVDRLDKALEAAEDFQTIIRKLKNFDPYEHDDDEVRYEIEKLIEGAMEHEN